MFLLLLKEVSSYPPCYGEDGDKDNDPRMIDRGIKAGPTGTFPFSKEHDQYRRYSANHQSIIMKGRHDVAM